MSETPPDELAWAAALAELRELLRGIEEEDVDLDVLGVRVERAAALIRACRARIQRTEMSVRAVLEDLERDKEGS